MFYTKPKFVHLKDSKYIEDVMYRMIYMNGSDFASASGSCVCVGFPYFITAKHVVMDYINQTSKSDIKTDKVTLDRGVSAFTQTISSYQIVLAKATESGTFISLLVDELYLPINKADLALMKVRVGNIEGDNSIPRTVLDLRVPALGGIVCSAGFANSETHVELSNGGINISVNDDFVKTTGEIVEVFTEKRDSIRLNFPCFQSNLKLVPSMSGGPVFNDLGFLCGLNCGSFDFAEEEIDNGDISYIASLISLIYIVNSNGKSLFLQLVRNNDIIVADKANFLAYIENNCPNLI